MRQGLRKIAELTPETIFLGEQPDIVGNAVQPLEQHFCVLGPPLQRQHIDKPEARGKERSLLTANAVVGLRYDASEIGAKGATEVLCYGTAIVIEAEQ